MQIVKTIAEMQELTAKRNSGSKTGFVPTMGALHRGHLSLVEQSAQTCDTTVVSIYVNPAQFGPNEDLEKYPRNLERDLELLSSCKTDYVFFPDNEQMYPAGYRTWIDVAGMSEVLCGATRRGHFQGVATIVMKLVNIVRPDLMFMGLKDFQQCVILETMLRDLNSHTQIVRCPIIRENDGLAMSSRNAYLSKDDRQKATSLYEALQTAREMVSAGYFNSREIIAKAEEVILRNGGLIDYISIVDSHTLEGTADVTNRSRMLLAVRIGNTRLIDNSELIP